MRPYDLYREAVANRQAPAHTSDARKDVALMFDQISPTLALAKAQLQLFGGVMPDSLHIVYLDGQWWVMANMWEKVADVPTH